MTKLTFLSSSLLAGDRSLTNVVCHEVMHSWAGNYVTNAQWNDFWLNEGFDVYLERLVLEQVHKSEAYRHFEILNGYNDLVKTVAALLSDNAEFTKLTPDMIGTDPDDAFSKIPYEKGSLFLFFLERTIHKSTGKWAGKGKEGMHSWLKTYFTDFRARSVTCAEMKAHFLAFFANGVDSATLNSIDWQTWLFGIGMPPYNPNEDKAVDRSLVLGCEALAQRWIKDEGKGTSKDDVKGFSSKQMMYFLDCLITTKVSPNPFGCDAKTGENALLAKINELYGLNKSPNVEIGFRYVMLCLGNGHRAALTDAHHFLSQHGRGLYTKPMYHKLAQLDKSFATATFQKHKPFYHAIIRDHCSKNLGLGPA